MARRPAEIIVKGRIVPRLISHKPSDIARAVADLIQLVNGIRGALGSDALELTVTATGPALDYEAAAGKLREILPGNWEISGHAAEGLELRTVTPRLSNYM